VRWRTDCALLFTDASRDGRRNAGYGTPADGVDIHHQEITMSMSQAQDRNEARGDDVEHVTDPLAGNRNQATKGESQSTDHEIAPTDRIEGEPTIWRASPSQWTKLGTYALSLVLAVGAVALGIIYLPWLALLLLIPAAFAGWTYLNVRARVYELTTERLRFYSGVFDRNIEEIELYRIKDSTIDKPFHLRIFGLGNVHILTSDRSRPSVELHGITDVHHVRDQLRYHVEKVRDEKGVREVDFDRSGDAAGAE
jgi:hypothetical protein